MKHAVASRHLIILVIALYCCAARADDKTPWPTRPKSPGVLREASTTKFPFRLDFAADDMVLGPRFLYVKQAQALVVVDRETGKEVAIQSLYRGNESARWIQGLVTNGALRIIVVRDKSISVLGLADPARPTTGLELTESPCGNRGFASITPLHLGRHAIVVGAGCAQIVDLRDGTGLGRVDIARGYEVPSVAVGGAAESPVVAIHSYNRITTQHQFLVYDLSDLSQWRLMSSWPGYYYGTGGDRDWRRALFVDRGGTLVIDGSDAYSIHRVQTGELVARLPVPFDDEHAAAFSDVGDTRVLSIGTPPGVKLWDLIEPSTPRLVAELQGAAGSDRMSEEPLRRRLTASPDEPYLYYAVPATNEVRVVDVRDGTIAGRWQTTSGTLQSVVLGLPGPSRDVAVFGDRELANYHTQADIISFSNPSAPRPESRFVHEGVCRIGGFAPLSSRYLAVIDDAAPLVALVDATTGRILSTMNYSYGPGYTGIAGANESSIVLAKGMEARWLVVENGQLVAKPPITMKWDRVRTHIAPDSTIAQVVLEYDRSCFYYDCNAAAAFRITMPDGRSAQTPLPERLGGVRKIFFSQDGNKAILNEDTYFQSSGFGLVDFTDRAAPRFEWWREPWADAPRFVRDGAAVFTPILSSSNGVQGVLYDAKNGNELGRTESFGSHFAQLYDSKTLPFGSGASERALWTHWQQGTVLFDVSTNAPQVMAIWDTRVYDPPMLPRDCRSMYLVTPYYYSNDLWAIDTSGGVSWLGDAPIFGAQLVRPGFIVGLSGSTQLMVIRDTSLNRAPVAVAGTPQELECASPNGTTAKLDGTGSSDADSAPETQDDIASYDWSVDGSAVGSQSVADVTLSPGHHVASLTVVDLLDANDTDTVAIDVLDTRAPTVELSLSPVLDGPRFARQWLATSTAADQCDGALLSTGRLLLDPQVLAAPVSFQSATFESIDVLRTAAGIRVVLRGPGESAIRATWADAIGGHGLRYRLDQSAVLDLSRVRPTGSNSSLTARYLLSADGSVSDAAAWGAGADHVVKATATDAAGHEAATSVSLRRTLEVLCASVPQSASCVRLP